MSGILAGVAMLALFNTSPAQAGLFDGDVSNWLPSNYTVKIADFGTDQGWCYAWNYGNITCTTWWLPSGQADDQINGSNFDTDGFTVENSDYYASDNPSGWTYVTAGTWTKISNGANVNCNLRGDGPPLCTY